MKSWCSIQANLDDTVHVSIYDSIGSGGLSAQEFINNINSFQNTSKIVLDISSEGGSVQDGVAIYNALKNHPASIEVHITGWALSVASVIAMAGDAIYMAENGLMMIHNAWSHGSGNAEEMRKLANILEKASGTIIDIYAAKTSLSVNKIKSMCDVETWMTAQEALDYGFIDFIDQPIAISAQFDLSKFNPPEKIKGILMQVNKSQTHNQNQDPAIEAALVKDQSRRKDIRGYFKNFSDTPGVSELLAKCEDDVNCSVQNANDLLLQHLGSQSSPIVGASVISSNFGYDRVTDFQMAARDELLKRGGVKISDPSPMAEDLKRMSVVAIAGSILSMKGIHTVGKSNTEIIRAAYTSGDLPTLLSNTAGKAMQIGYQEEPATFTPWTGEKEVQNFKEQSLVKLSEAPDLKEVLEAGEYTYGGFGESAEKFSVKTYGRLFGLTRQALVNDDVDAFTSMPAAFGSASKRLEADSVYSKLTGADLMSDGKPLFHIDHGNLAASGSALSVNSLSKARSQMRRQRGINGKQFIDPVPRFLIVPVTLETEAEMIVSSLVDPSKNNDTANVQWVRNLTVIADPRLDMVSETAWYLAASPTQMDGIVRAYISGQDRPYYEVNDEFGRDLTSIKCRLDLTVGTVDYRALFKNPGAA